MKPERGPADHRRWYLLVCLALLIVAIQKPASVLAHIPGCKPEGVCCPDDDPNKCSDVGEPYKIESLCTTCQFGSGLQSCFYVVWYWDYNKDGITDCAESCFQGWAAGPCP